MYVLKSEFEDIEEFEYSQEVSDNDYTKLSKEEQTKYMWLPDNNEDIFEDE